MVALVDGLHSRPSKPLSNTYAWWTKTELPGHLQTSPLRATASRVCVVPRPTPSFPLLRLYCSQLPSPLPPTLPRPSQTLARPRAIKGTPEPLSSLTTLHSLL